MATFAIVALFAVGWIAAIVETATAGPASTAAPATMLGSAIAATPLSGSAPLPAAFLIDQAMKAFAGARTFGGHSGAVYVVLANPGDSALTVPGSLPPEADVALSNALGGGDTVPARTAPAAPGIWNVVLRLGGISRAVPGVTVITMVPFSAKRAGRIGSYMLGSWPYENGGKPRNPAYFPPRGFVQVTPQNEDLHLTEHIRLRDYITKGQNDVWPKYIAVSPRELDKIELTIQEMEREGHAFRLGVISAFRNPNYNYHGGNTEGRAQLSRHMYGDAMDIYDDPAGRGCMNDLNGDGRVDVNDARILARAAQAVEQKYPDLVGGIGVYAPTGAHCGFVHIDTRGFRARWGAW
ncbi:MAG TPA: hypothetical protein VF832_16610 [Longimicrobiales bacterium]